MAFREFSKILEYFNGTSISTFFIFTLPSAMGFPVILILDLNDSEFSIASAGSSL